MYPSNAIQEDVTTESVAAVYYSGCFTSLHRSESVELLSKSTSSSLVRGRAGTYDLWISGNGNYHCSCPFTLYQTIESREPCKHVLSLALAYLHHKGFFNETQPTQ